MKDPPNKPRDLTRRMKERKCASLRALAEYYILRSKRQNSPYRREHLAKAAEYYRELAKFEEEVVGKSPTAAR